MVVKWWRKRRAIVCEQAVRLMAGYLDGALPDADRRRLEAHLADCPHCSEHLAQLRIAIVAAGHAQPEDLPNEVVDDLVAVFRRWQQK